MSSFDASRTLGKNPKFSGTPGPHGRVDPRLELPEPKVKSIFRASYRKLRGLFRRRRKKMAGRLGGSTPVRTLRGWRSC